MVHIAIFASGNGSNFEALAKHFENSSNFKIDVLIYDRKEAFAVKRAEKFGIESTYVDYSAGKELAEDYIIGILKRKDIDIVFLAGFMRILSKKVIDIGIPIVNIHPSLLPKYKGTHSIERGYNSDDEYIGVTIHYVNEGVDEGEIIVQESIPLDKNKTLAEVEDEIHKLEHKLYCSTADMLCNKLL